MTAYDSPRREMHRDHIEPGMTETMKTADIQAAWVVWCVLGMEGPNGIRAGLHFYAYLGPYHINDKDTWCLTPEGYRRMGYLLGPNANTMARAWQLSKEDA